MSNEPPDVDVQHQEMDTSRHCVIQNAKSSGVASTHLLRTDSECRPVLLPVALMQ